MSWILYQSHIYVYEGFNAIAIEKKILQILGKPRLQFSRFDVICRLIAKFVTHFINLGESYFADKKVIYVEVSRDRSFAYTYFLASNVTYSSWLM